MVGWHHSLNRHEFEQTQKDSENSLMDSVGEAEGGMIWENGIETCVISYMKRVKIGRAHV